LHTFYGRSTGVKGDRSTVYARVLAVRWCGYARREKPFLAKRDPLGVRRVRRVRETCSPDALACHTCH
jgi:hypothetical protein